MTLRNDLIQAVRTAVKTYGDPAGALTDAQVKNDHLDYARPEGAYASVAVPIIDRSLSALGDEKVHGISGGLPTLAIHGKREAVCRIQYFRDAGVEWASNFKLALQRQDVIDALQALGIGLVLETPVTPLVTTVGVGREVRAFQDFVINYRVRTATLGAAQGIVPATSVDLDVDFTETADGPAVLTLDTTIAL